MTASLQRYCAVSVDLDEISNYHAIYGIPLPPGTGARLVYERAIERLGEFARKVSIPITFFAVGADADREQNAVKLRELHRDGHEISNHSYDHLYNLSRLSPVEMHRQVAEGAGAIQRAVGVRPKGFRAPGYVINDTLVQVLVGCGVQYDSSVFPCPAYFSLKAAAMTWISIRGRTSRSVQDHPRVLAAPTTPYRMGTTYCRTGDGLVEIPIQVTRGLRLPYYGTALCLAGRRGAEWLTRMVIGRNLVNLELHGIDALDVADGLQDLAGRQRDVRLPVADKLGALEAAILELRHHGYEFIRLDRVEHCLAL